MKIRFPEITPVAARKVFIGDHDRFATMTSVQLIDKQHLLACHFLGRRMFLVRFSLEEQSHEILDEHPTVFRGNDVSTDLLDYSRNGSVAVTSNFNEGSQTLYTIDLDSKKIKFLREIALNSYKQCHGVRFLEFGERVLLVSTYNHPSNPVVEFVDLGGDWTRHSNFRSRLWARLPLGLRKRLCEESVVATLHCESRAQDVNRIGPYLIVLGRERSVSPTKQRSDHSLTTTVELYRQGDGARFDFKLVDRWKGYGHLDALAVCGDKFYATNQYTNGVEIFTVANERIEKIDEIKAFSFPHGVSVLDDLMAVSNYGDNTVSLLTI